MLLQGYGWACILCIMTEQLVLMLTAHAFTLVCFPAGAWDLHALQQAACSPDAHADSPC